MKCDRLLRKYTAKVWQVVIIGMASLVNPASVLADPVGTDWTLMFSDDFDGTVLDVNKWNTCYWWGCTNAANHELELYQPDDVMVQYGTLHLRAQQRSANGYNYTSGMIDSHDRFAFQYGYVEMRAKLPKGQGLWPTFWLLSRNGWPPEIDIMENLGHEPNRVHLTFHYNSSSDHLSSGTHWDGPDFSADYHTFAVEWNPQRLIWYVDGVEQKRYEDATQIPAEPMYILANLAVGGDWPGSPDASTPFPSYFDIDYIKVWQKNSY